MGWFVHRLIRLESLPVVEPTLGLTDPKQLFPIPCALFIQWSVTSLALFRYPARYCLARLRAFTHALFPPMFLPPLSSLAS